MALFRSKPVLITGSAIAAVLLAGAIALLAKGRRGADSARLARNRARTELERFYAHNPFPTPENIELTRQHRAELQDWFERLRETVRAGQPERTQLSPAGFIQRLNARVNDLRTQSPRIAGARVVPDNFTFGFDAYLGADAALPQPEHVQRLADQLTLVELLAQQIYAADVMRLNALTRERFDRPDAQPERGARRADGRGVAQQPDTPLFSHERFQLTLRLRPESLSLLLNRLSEMQPVVVVRQLGIRKSGPDLRAADRERTGGARAGTRPSPTPFRLPGFDDAPADRETQSPGATETPEGPPPRESRLISGPDVDPPLDVTLEILVYRFNGE